MTLRHDTFRVRLQRTVRDTVIKLTRVARAALHRLERARVSYAVGPLGTSDRPTSRHLSRA